jgi:hypothetical protein
MDRATSIPQPERRRRFRGATRQTLRPSRATVLAVAARVSVALCFLLLAPPAEGGEPVPQVAVEAAAPTSTTASETLVPHDGPVPSTSKQFACPFGICRIIDHRKGAGTLNSMLPLLSNGLQSEAKGGRLAPVGGRRLGLRILQGVYAVVSVTSASLGPTAPLRTPAQRIHVGLQCVVNF